MSATQAQETTEALRLCDVSRRFGGLQAVQSVSFAVGEGERRAILGPNGAGKTTLFNLIAGDIQPTSGNIVLFGTDVTKLPAHQRARRGLTRTYQAAHCFSGLTVLENLFLAIRGTQPRRLSFVRPSRDSDQLQRAREIAAEVGLSNAITSLVARLSHGEQRQLELGMALAGNPRMIIVDEPAAGLSPGERSRLTDLLLALNAAITLLIIEHDMDVALRVADVVTVMHDGAILVHGTPKEILDSQAVHDLYLGVSHG